MMEPIRFSAWSQTLPYDVWATTTLDGTDTFFGKVADLARYVAATTTLDETGTHCRVQVSNLPDTLPQQQRWMEPIRFSARSQTLPYYVWATTTYDGTDTFFGKVADLSQGSIVLLEI